MSRGAEMEISIRLAEAQERAAELRERVRGKLLPCPLCGGSAVYLDNFPWEDDQGGLHANRHVHCAYCGCRADLVAWQKRECALNELAMQRLRELEQKR
jgi:hypothetical protein